MPIDAAAQETIKRYQQKGIAPNIIISKLISHPTYSDLAPSVDRYLKKGVSVEEVLEKMKTAPVGQSATPAPLNAVERANNVPSNIQPHHGETQIRSISPTKMREDQVKLGMREMTSPENLQTLIGAAAPAGVPAPMLADMFKRQIPNVAKKAVGVLGLGGGKNQAAKLLKTDVLDPMVDTVMSSKGRLNPTSGKLQSQVSDLQKGLMSERATLAQPGEVVPRKVVEDAIRENIAEMRRIEPQNIEKITKAEQYLTKIQETWPDSISTDLASERLTHLGREIKTWDKSLVKDVTATGEASAKKAVYPELRNALAETSTDPKRYTQINKEYSNLSDLFSPGLADASRSQPAQLADKTIAAGESFGNSGLTRLLPTSLIEKARWPLSKASYNLNKIGKNQIPEETGLYKYLEPMLKGAPYEGKPLTIKYSRTARGNPITETPTEEYLQQMKAQHAPVPESTPGSLMEGDVPYNSFKNIPPSNATLSDADIQKLSELVDKLKMQGGT